MTSDPFSGVVPDRRGSDREDADDLLLWWWWVGHDEQEGGSHMDLRRWLQSRYEEGWRHMRMERIGSSSQRQIVLRGSGTRQVERPLWPSERKWLLGAWPAELQPLGDRPGLLSR
jgi:hypothetical protein